MEKDIEEDIRFGGQAKSGDLKKNDAGKDQGGVLKSRIFDMSQNKYPLGGINDIVAPLLGSVRGILADNLARHFFMASVDFFFLEVKCLSIYTRKNHSSHSKTIMLSVLAYLSSSKMIDMGELSIIERQVK